MKRPQIILTIVAVILTIVLYRLPKVVVDNESAPVDEREAPSAVDQAHNTEIPPEQKASITELQQKMSNAENTEKSAIFADSLAQAFLELSILDSAVFYIEQAARINPNEQSWQRAGDVCFEALSFAVEKDRGERFGERSRFYYEKILDSSPGRLDLKTRIAMTYVSTSNPMKGITILREVLAEDPENVEAISNLGILSLQSAQYDRAIERFERLVELDPNNIQGQVLLGISYKEAGKRAQARDQFERVKTLTRDSSILATVESYLADIN